MHRLREAGLAVDERSGVKGGKPPLVRVHDEGVGALDADVAIANPGGEHACAAVGAIDMEPPVVLRRNVGRGGEIVDDPGIRGAARRDDRRDIAQIMIGGEGPA